MDTKIMVLAVVIVLVVAAAAYITAHAPSGLHNVQHGSLTGTQAAQLAQLLNISPQNDTSYLSQSNLIASP